MKFIKTYIIRPFSVIIPLYLCFSFVAGSMNANEWHIVARIFFIVALLVAFATTEPDEPTI